MKLFHLFFFYFVFTQASVFMQPEASRSYGSKSSIDTENDEPRKGFSFSMFRRFNKKPETV